MDYANVLKAQPFYEKMAKPDFDKLTGVLTRDSFFDYMQSLVSSETPFAMCIIDIDNFKRINDTYGHVVGDSIIISTVEQITEAFDPPLIIGRFGGDEFLIIFDCPTDYDSVWKQAFDIHHCFASPVPEIPVTITMGISRFPLDGNSVHDVFEIADKALYRGKTKGRNCFIIYNQELHKDMDLKTRGDVKISLQYLFTQSYIILNREGSYKKNVMDVFLYLSNHFMFDCIAVQSETKCLMKTVAKSAKDVPVDFIPSEYITNFMNSSGLFVLTSNEKMGAKNIDLYEINKSRKVSSQMVIKIEYRGRFFGLVRAEMISMERIWQTDEITLFYSLCQHIAQHLYFSGKTMDDETW